MTNENEITYGGQRKEQPVKQDWAKEAKRINEAAKRQANKNPLDDLATARESAEPDDQGEATLMS